MTTSRFEVEKFDGRNDFNLWREKMIAHLGNLGLDDALQGESKIPDSIQNKGEVLKKARNTIILSLSDQILRKVVKEKSVCDMWNNLEQLYMTKALPNRIYLKQRFYGYKMDENKSIDESIDEFTKLHTDLENIEVKIDEEDQAIFLLNALPKPYDQLRDTLKYRRDTLTLDEVTGAAYSKELDLRAAGKHYKSVGEGLNIRGRSPVRKDINYKGRNQSRSRSRPKMTCCFCKKEGCFRRNCPKRRSHHEPDSKPANDSANLLEAYEEAEVLTISSDDPKEDWIMDSGCTYHMSPRKDWFFDFKDLEAGQVLMGNNQSCKIQGIGSIKLRMWDGSLTVITEVRYIPDLKRNLISLSILDQKGFGNKAQDGVLKVLKGSLVIMKGILRQGLYVLQAATITQQANMVVPVKDLTEIWPYELKRTSRIV